MVWILSITLENFVSKYLFKEFVEFGYHSTSIIPWVKPKVNTQVKPKYYVLKYTRHIPQKTNIIVNTSQKN